MTPACPRTQEIASHPPSPEGLYDLAGSVAELTLYDGSFATPGYPDAMEQCSSDHISCKPVISRGGWELWWDHPPSVAELQAELRAAHRALFWTGLGLRCVRNL